MSLSGFGATRVRKSSSISSEHQYGYSDCEARTLLPAHLSNYTRRPSTIRLQASSRTVQQTRQSTTDQTVRLQGGTKNKRCELRTKIQQQAYLSFLSLTKSVSTIRLRPLVLSPIDSATPCPYFLFLPELVCIYVHACTRYGVLKPVRPAIIGSSLPLLTIVDRAHSVDVGGD